MNFGERLKGLRSEKGLSQAKLAKEIGVAVGTVSVWERGGRKPEFQTLDNLAEFFDVSLPYLLGQSNIRDRYPKHDGSLEDPVSWTESELEEIKDMSNKIARMSYRSKRIAKATIDALYKQDKLEENLVPEGIYIVDVKGEK